MSYKHIVFSAWLLMAVFPLSVVAQTTTISVKSEAAPTVVTLETCRQWALGHNEQIKAAGIAERKAELDRQIAYTHYLPQVDGAAATIVSKDNDLMGMKLQMRGAWLAGINIVEPLYAGGQITTGNRLAAMAQDMAVLQSRRTRADVLADVDKAYYTLISVHGKVRMLEAYQELMKGLYEQVNRSVNAQLATANDLLRIESKQTEISYQLQKAKNGETICQLALANAVGADLGTQLTPKDTVLTIAAPTHLDENLSQRPELQMLQKTIGIREQQVRMARAGMLPTVALALGYTQYGNIKMKGSVQALDGNYYPFTQKFNGNMPMAMLTVKVPIFHWGAELKKVKKAQLDVDNARLALQQNERGMRIEVRQSVQNLTDGYRMTETAMKGLEQAKENLRVMRQKYNNQMATMTDLLDAQSQWQQARSNLIEAQTQYKIYETEYLKATGRL